LGWLEEGSFWWPAAPLIQDGRHVTNHSEKFDFQISNLRSPEKYFWLEMYEIFVFLSTCSYKMQQILLKNVEHFFYSTMFGSKCCFLVSMTTLLSSSRISAENSVKIAQTFTEIYWTMPPLSNCQRGFPVGNPNDVKYAAKDRYAIYCSCAVCAMKGRTLQIVAVLIWVKVQIEKWCWPKMSYSQNRLAL
jgi:hypothetical protein